MNCLKVSKGFTLLESVFALWIVSFCLVLLVSCMQLMRNIELSNLYAQDDMALYKIRLMLALSKDVEEVNDNLDFSYENTNYTMYLYEDKIILIPGYQVLLQDVDNMYIEVSNNVYYLVYERENKITKRFIYETL